jgi:hypothetical protein
LLASGAPISAMNAIRKHVSGIKGGRLAAAAWPAKVVSLVVSDIPGDDPALVASGPTIPDKSTREDALRYIERYRLELPEKVMAFIRSDASGAPNPADQEFHAATRSGLSPRLRFRWRLRLISPVRRRRSGHPVRRDGRRGAGGRARARGDCPRGLPLETGRSASRWSFFPAARRR